MSQHIFNLWKEASSSKPIRRDAFKSMHLAAFPAAGRNIVSDELYIIRHSLNDFILYEAKGKLQDTTSLALPHPDTDTLWLCLQFHGRTVFSNGKATQPDSLFAFQKADEATPLTLAAERHWALFLGLSAASKQKLLAELPTLRDHFDSLQQDILPAVPIYRTEYQAMETFASMDFGPFSTLHHIGLLYLKLYSNYLQRVETLMLQPKDEPHVRLYHLAVAYIRDNYLEQALDRETIADALHCSTRSLSRAFEGRPLSLNATILTFRLYKGRELLVQNPKLSVEKIAFSLHFPDAKHFTVQYKKQFHRTPRQERKMLVSPKE